ncbi:MAG: outer membrane beta-barrel protein, partial [Bacteroidota bacterium]
MYNKQPITKQLALSLNVSTSISFLNLENLGLPNPDSYVNAKATLTANYNFWKNAGIQLFGNFKTRSISAFGSMGNYQYIDFAFSKRISSKLSANLTITGIFNLNEFTYKNSSTFLINSGFNKRETRIGKISYSFGKVKENKVVAGLPSLRSVILKWGFLAQSQVHSWISYKTCGDVQLIESIRLP